MGVCSSCPTRSKRNFPESSSRFTFSREISKLHADIVIRRNEPLSVAMGYFLEILKKY
jgi:hypothetical protein